MREFAVLVALLLVPLAASAGTVPDLAITSVSTSEGPVAGGTVVQIRGTGFESFCNCSPVRLGTAILFGGTRASVHFIDSTHLEVVTPPHPPGTVAVTAEHDGESATLPNAFTFTGDILSGFDAFLFPVFSPPIDGALGSRFETSALVANLATHTAGTPPSLPLYGAEIDCADPSRRVDDPLVVSRNYEATLVTQCSTWPARVIYAPKALSGDLTASLRVADVSRRTQNHGVEVPVVKLEDFRRDRIALIGVPSDARFRHTLRIYSIGGGRQVVGVRVNFGPTLEVPLTPGRTLYEPAFATVTSLPPGANITNRFFVIVDTPRNGDDVVEDAPLIWAFLTVTNNDTQLITTITPQR